MSRLTPRLIPRLDRNAQDDYHSQQLRVKIVRWREVTTGSTKCGSEILWFTGSGSIYVDETTPFSLLLQYCHKLT